MTFQHN